MKRHPEELWFGWGFDWIQKHAQLAYEILKRDVSTLIPTDHQRMGSAWIHGLEISESAVRQPIQHTAGHTLIVGTTGAGKTRAFDLLVTQAVLRGEAVIIIDPKGDKDLMASAKRACQLAKRPDRFVYFHPAFPEDSVRLDPLHNFNRPSEIASRITAISPGETTTDPFMAFGQKSLDNVIQGLMVIEERPTLAKLRRYLEGGPSTLVVQALERYYDNCLGDWRRDARPYLKAAKDIDSKAAGLVRFYRDVVQQQAANLDLEGLLSLFEHDRTHFSKMVASLIPIMNMLTSGHLGPLLSPNPLDADDLRPITNTGHIIEKAQMDSETQQYITDNLPKTRLKYIMRTQGVATSATHPGVFSGNAGERLMEEEGDLFAPQLLGQLPDLH